MSKSPVFQFLVNKRALGLSSVLMAVVSSGCLAPKTVRPLGSAVAIKGQQVSSAALSAYDDLAKQPDIDRSQQNTLKIVTSPNPSTVALSTTNADMSVQLAPRVAAYRSLLRTYSTYQVLTDKNFGAQAETATAALVTSYNALKAIPDAPAAVAAAAPALAAAITEAEQSRQIRKHNRALSELTKRYRTLWQSDLPIWKQYLDGIYNQYADGLSGLGPDRFDPTRLNALTKQPYSKDMDAGFFKLQQMDAARAQRDLLVSELSRVDQAFGELTLAQAELSNAKPNLSDALAALDTVDGILGVASK